ncbi:MAG: hypothetical protein JWO83_2229 [Caulobacteraceae bacterium]|nr:hypothetical protein [Caulobacteraceae bacterium]
MDGVPLDYIVLRLARETAVARARDRPEGPLPDYPPNIFEGFAHVGGLETHVLQIGDASLETLAETVRAGLCDERFRLG